MTRSRRMAGWVGAAFVASSMALGCESETRDFDGDGGQGGAGGDSSSSSASGGAGGAGGIPSIGEVGKVDLLLMIDNSRSMADKQEILSLTVPDLVRALINPRCVHANGAVSATQPSGPSDPCPEPATEREFKPVTDLHIGIISSSLGGHGSDACPDQESNTCSPNVNYGNNDKGHLVVRMSECGSDIVPTYQNKGFLAWDPEQNLNPAGEANADSLNASLTSMVTGIGQVGCGFESQLESWYRFLVDPEPYDKISIVNNQAVPEGTDVGLLTQRADFLRPDSVLAVIMLSDENDCSIKEYGQFYLASQLKNANFTPFHMPRPRQECASNPNDPCCKSCAEDAGSCPADPTCFDANNNLKALTDLEDAINVRCFDQKRRFGIDFLYPIDRYTKGLSSQVVPNRSGELVPNPIFSDLIPQDAVTTIRDPGLVFIGGIVGVPWQDLVRDPSSPPKGLKDSNELLAKNAAGLSTWDIILGDPASYVPPKDPHMIESIDPREGTSPITGDPIKPPGDPSNPINGSEFDNKSRDDLQFACIFPLPMPRNCSDASILSCDCKDPQNDLPLCAPDLLDPTKRTLQIKAKAYPGLRHLALLQQMGPQAVAASVCPVQLTDATTPDFGYRLAMTALVERVKPRLIGGSGSN